MIQELFDKHIFLYAMAGVCAIGICLKLMLFLGYGRLIRATDSVATTKKKWIKQMKMKFESFYTVRIGVNNVDVFVDKYVNKRKFCGVLLSTWESISGQAIPLCLAIGSFSGIMGLIFECERNMVIFTFFAGAWTSILVAIVDNIVNLGIRREILRINLIDYFDNFLKVRLEQETFFPSALEKYRMEYFSEGRLESASAQEAVQREARPSFKRGPQLLKSDVSSEKTASGNGEIVTLYRRKEQSDHIFKTENLSKRDINKVKRFEQKMKVQCEKQEQSEKRLKLKLEKHENKLLKKKAYKEAKEQKNQEKVSKSEIKKQLKEQQERKAAEEKEQAKLAKQQSRRQFAMDELKKKENASKAIMTAEPESSTTVPETAQEEVVIHMEELTAKGTENIERRKEEDKLIEDVLREFLA